MITELLTDDNFSLATVTALVEQAAGDEARLADICDRACDIAAFFMATEWPGTAAELENNPTLSFVDANIKGLARINLDGEYAADLATMRAVRVAVAAYDAALSA